ncbi:MAG: polyprenyl diphosphate synthase [Thermovirga sp.]
MNTAGSDPSRMPVHVAIIMDGNGRWAKMRKLPRLSGHHEGIRTVERTIRAVADAKIPYLSLYAFSTENWKRPKTEIEGLMGLFRYYLRLKVSELKENGVRILFSGRLHGLPDDLLEEVKSVEEKTSANRKITVVACINYGGRQEIVDSVNRILEQGECSMVTEEMISARTYQPHIPDPDLVIRTSGETRLSNFLLWQTAYSELYFTDVLWPDFSRKDLQKALDYYSARERRYGAVKEV